MPNYVKLAATAERLIQKAGRAVTLVKFETGEDDSDEPHWGTAVPRDGATEVSLTGVFVGVEDLVKMGFVVQEDSPQFIAKSKEKAVLLSAKEAGTNLLETFQELIDGTVRYGIRKMHILQPGATRLLYAAELIR